MKTAICFVFKGWRHVFSDDEKGFNECKNRLTKLINREVSMDEVKGLINEGKCIK